MSFSRLFAIVAVIGLIVAAALTIRSAGTTSAAVESVGTTDRGNVAEGILELHNRQEAAGNSTVASVSTVRGNVAEGIIELHRHFELQGSQIAAGNSTVARAGTVQENIAERSFELRDQLAQVRAATAASQRNMAEGIIELHKRYELAGQD